MSVYAPIYAAITRPIGSALGRAFEAFPFPDATALYSAYYLGQRGSVTEAEGTVINPVQRWRNGNGGALNMHTAKDIADGTALASIVPTDVQNLYGSARYFNGTGAEVNITQNIFAGDFDLSATIYSDFSETRSFFADNAGLSAEATRIYISASTGDLVLTPNAGAAVSAPSGLTLGVNQEVTVRVVRVSGTIRFYINGSEVGTPTSSTDTFIISTIGGIRGAGGTVIGFKGVIRNVNINNQAAFTGLGTSVTAWEDTIGSNDGTEANGATFTGQGYDAYLLTEYDQSGSGNDGTETTAANQAQVVKDGTLTLDGVSNISALFDVTDDWTFANAFTGLTAANVYAITDNAGVVTLDTLTAQDITLVTTLSGLLASLTYDHVTAVLIYPDATNQSEIEAKLLTIFDVT